jgi:hypothetical protein
LQMRNFIGSSSSCCGGCSTLYRITTWRSADDEHRQHGARNGGVISRDIPARTTSQCMAQNTALTACITTADGVQVLQAAGCLREASATRGPRCGGELGTKPGAYKGQSTTNQVSSLSTKSPEILPRPSAHLGCIP